MSPFFVIFVRQFFYWKSTQKEIGTQRALQGYSKSTRANEHSKDTWALETLGQSKVTLSTQALKTPGDLGTQLFGHKYLKNPYFDKS